MPIVSRMPATKSLWQPQYGFPNFVSAGAGASSSSSPTTLTEAAFIGPGNCAIVLVHTWPGRTSTVTRGGVTVDPFGGPQFDDNVQADGGIQLFGLMGPPTTSASTVATIASGASFGWVITLIYNNVGGVVPVATTFGSSVNGSQVVANPIIGSVVVQGWGMYKVGTIGFSWGTVGQQRAAGPLLGTQTQAAIGDAQISHPLTISANWASSLWSGFQAALLPLQPNAA